jgi:hypothetical protein
MVIWKDLYSVFGGFVTWTYEGLGIISFTNELWSADQLYSKKEQGGWFGGTSSDDRQWFMDNLLLEAGWVPWHEVQHPTYGTVEVGGYKKDVMRVPPTFLIEEMLHRNALFCLKHARSMPRVAIRDAVVTNLADGLRAIDVVFANERAIPTRTAQAAEHGIGTPDLFLCSGKDIAVVAGGVRTDRWHPERIELAERAPERLVREEGIPGRGEVRVRWIVRGGGDRVTIAWKGEKALDVELQLRLE